MESQQFPRGSIKIILGAIGPVTVLSSFRCHPGSTIKDLCFILFPVAFEILNHAGWIKTLRIILPLTFTLVVGSLLTWVSVVPYVQRELVLRSNEHSVAPKTFLGRPLLFPARLTHSRMFPEKYNYWINYFLVGVPVGLRGRVGTVMSIDSDPRASKPSTSVFFRSSMNQFLTRILWFRVDTNLYLHRGDGNMGLVAKLQCFLEEQVSTVTQNFIFHMLSTHSRARTRANTLMPT